MPVRKLIAVGAALGLGLWGLGNWGNAVADPAPASVAAEFRMPFGCGQEWTGQTRTGHRPPPAVDFNRANDSGDAVVASAAGTVSNVDDHGEVSYGKWIEIDHGGGWSTRYAHLSVQRVSTGEFVSRGEVIGNLGNTGSSTGPHLHFEQLLNGTARRIAFDGVRIHYYGTRDYTSKNCP